MKRATVLIVSLALAGGVGVVASPVAGADTAIAGTYNAVAPQRIVDTRSGVGTAKAAIAARGTLNFQAVTPLGATSASALALTITAIAPARTGYLVAYSGATRPATSSLNFQAKSYVANSVVVAVGDTGIVSIYNGSAGTLNLAVDATGYWTSGEVDADTAGALHTVAPARLYDSRTGENTAVPAGGDRSVTVAGVDGVPNSGVSAVVVNAAVVGPTAGGYLSVVQQPENGDTVTSSINFDTGASRSDLVVLAVDQDGALSLHNGSVKPLNVLLDIVGYISDGTPTADGASIISTAYRAFDDRVGSTPVPANGTRSYAVLPDGTGVKAAVVTVAAVRTTQYGYVVPLNADRTTPPTSGLNHLAKQNVAQAMIVPVAADGTISLRNVSPGTVTLVIDVSGFVLNDDAMSGSAKAHRVATAMTQARHAAAVRLAH